MGLSSALPRARAGLTLGAALLVFGAAATWLPTTAAADADDRFVVALTTDNTLIGFNPRQPDRARSHTPIANLKPGEQLVGIDYRPLTGRLYGVGSTSQVYVIDSESGFATPVGAPFAPALAGTDFGVDFNPQADRLRVVSDTGQNLRINPDSGGTIADAPLAYAAADRNSGRTPAAVGAAYSNSVARASSTVLFDIDAAQDVLVRQAPPNDGTLTTLGDLGLDTGARVGFDIASGDSRAARRLRRLVGQPEGDVALGALQLPTGQRLVTLDLSSGRATDRGSLLEGVAVRDIAIPVLAVVGDDVVALTSNNQLLGFGADSPGRIRTRAEVTGLQPDERLVGIDVRPATGRLYGVGSTGRVYVIDQVTGVAAAIGTAPFTPALDGAEFGVDFNPQVDRLRVVSASGQNLRLNPDTGAVAGTDTALQYAVGDANAGRQPTVVGAAYTSNRPGTPSTVLYDIDSGLDTLATQAPPNNGTLNTIGPLGIDTAPLVGFDIGSPGRRAATREIGLAALQRDGQSRLYAVDLDTGRARDRGRIGDGSPVRDIAITTTD